MVVARPQGEGRWSWGVGGVVVLVVLVEVVMVVGGGGGCGGDWKLWVVREGGGDVVGLVGVENLVEMRVNFGEEKEEE